MTLKNDPNFQEKLIFGIKCDMWNLMNFNLSSGKSKNLHFDGYFCRMYVMFDLNNTEELCREKWLVVSKIYLFIYLFFYLFIYLYIYFSTYLFFLLIYLAFCFNFYFTYLPFPLPPLKIYFKLFIMYTFLLSRYALNLLLVMLQYHYLIFPYLLHIT